LSAIGTVCAVCPVSRAVHCPIRGGIACPISRIACPIRGIGRCNVRSSVISGKIAGFGVGVVLSDNVAEIEEILGVEHSASVVNKVLDNPFSASEFPV